MEWDVGKDCRVHVRGLCSTDFCCTRLSSGILRVVIANKTSASCRLAVKVVSKAFFSPLLFVVSSKLTTWQSCACVCVRARHMIGNFRLKFSYVGAQLVTGLSIYSKTCLKRPPHGARKSGRFRQVVSKARFPRNRPIFRSSVEQLRTLWYARV